MASRYNDFKELRDIWKLTIYPRLLHSAQTRLLQKYGLLGWRRRLKWVKDIPGMIMRRRRSGSVTIGMRLLKNRGRIGANGDESTQRYVKQFWNWILIVVMVPLSSWLILLFVINRNKKIWLSIMRRRRSTSDSIGMRLIKEMTIFFITSFASLVTSDEHFFL